MRQSRWVRCARVQILPVFARDFRAPRWPNRRFDVPRARRRPKAHRDRVALPRTHLGAPSRLALAGSSPPPVRRAGTGPSPRRASRVRSPGRHINISSGSLRADLVVRAPTSAPASRPTPVARSDERSRRGLRLARARRRDALAARVGPEPAPRLDDDASHSAVPRRGRAPRDVHPDVAPPRGRAMDDRERLRVAGERRPPAARASRSRAGHRRVPAPAPHRARPRPGPRHRVQPPARQGVPRHRQPPPRRRRRRARHELVPDHARLRLRRLSEAPPPELLIRRRRRGVRPREGIVRDPLGRLGIRLRAPNDRRRRPLRPIRRRRRLVAAGRGRARPVRRARRVAAA